MEWNNENENGIMAHDMHLKGEEPQLDEQYYSSSLPAINNNKDYLRTEAKSIDSWCMWS